MSTETAPVKFVHTRASVLLDLVRGLAALLVLLQHWRNAIFTSYTHLAPGLEHWMILPYLLTDAGHQAVVVFFVLSGYLISGSVFRMLDRHEWSWRVYGLHRLSRLWIVLVPGLLLGGLFDYIGMHSGQSQAGYAHLAPSLQQFFGNLFFLQIVFLPAFGSNGALWSLSYEFWYYVLFPLGLLVLLRKSSVPVRVGQTVLFLAIAWMVRGEILLFFPLWLAGVLLVKIPAPHVGARVRWLAAAIYLPLLLIMEKQKLVPFPYGDYISAAATTLFLWLLLSARDRVNQTGAFARFSRGLSRFSFTMYVCHMPMLVLCVAFLTKWGLPWQPGVRSVALASVLLAWLILYTWCIAWLTEFRTDKVRGWVEQKLGMKQERPTSHEAALAAAGLAQGDTSP